MSAEMENEIVKKQLVFNKFIPHFHNFTNLQFTLCFVPPNKVLVCDVDGFYLMNVENGSRLGYHKWIGPEINDSLKRFTYRPADNTIFMCYNSSDKTETVEGLVGYNANDLDQCQEIDLPKHPKVVNKNKTKNLKEIFLKSKLLNSTLVVTVLNGSTLLLAINAGRKGSALFLQQFKSNLWTEIWYSKIELDDPFFDIKHVFHNKEGDHAVYIAGINTVYKFVLNGYDQSMKGLESMRISGDLCCLITIGNGIFYFDTTVRQIREITQDYDKGSVGFEPVLLDRENLFVGFASAIYFAKQLITLTYNEDNMPETKLRLFDVKP